MQGDKASSSGSILLVSAVTALLELPEQKVTYTSSPAVMACMQQVIMAVFYFKSEYV